MSPDYRTRTRMFGADFAATQQPFQSTGDISLTTGLTDAVYPLRGDFLYIDQASTGSVYVELNAKQGGTLAPVLLAAGGSIEIPDGGFDSIKINAAAQLNKSVRIIVGNGARIKGGANVNAASMSVSVVDGGLIRTQANQSFIGQASAAATAAQYSHAQLWNPVGSGKNLYLESVIASCTSAQGVLIGSYNTALGGAGPAAMNKYVGQAVGVGLTKFAANAAVLYADIAQQFYLSANLPVAVKFTEPILIPPGKGIIVAGLTVNIGVIGSFEWYEQ